MGGSDDRLVLSKWVERGMKARGYNQSTLAEVSGVSRDTISRVVHGKTGISRQNLEKLAVTLNSPPPKLSDSVFEDDGEHQTSKSISEERGAFVVGVRAMTETMRRQIEALDHLVGTDERAKGIHEMLASMMRQVGALEILLLGNTTRAGGVNFEALIEDMKVFADRESGGAGDADRRTGGDRRTG